LVAGVKSAALVVRRCRFPPFLNVAWHKHSCICGAIWNCKIDIIPVLNDHHHRRALCKEWTESFCDHCLRSILQAQGATVLRELSQSEAADPSTRLRISTMISDRST
jgi:hypothetical protein